MDNQITTIAFDYGGVIAYKIDETYLCHMADSVSADVTVFQEALWKHRNEYDAGGLNAEAYWTKVIVDAGGVSSPEAIRMLMHLDSYAWATINPAMLRWMATLRDTGFRRVVVSNMAEETYDMIIRDSLWLPHFERVVLSGSLRINKPNRAIFLEAARQMGVKPAEMLFIDDLEHNVAGARAAGLHALQFRDAKTLAVDLERDFPSIPRTGLCCGVNGRT